MIMWHRQASVYETVLKVLVNKYVNMSGEST